MSHPDRRLDPQRHVVVMGVSGAGKSQTGMALATRLARPFLEGDDLRSPQTVATMSAGVALDDDRRPWLERLGIRGGRRRCGVDLVGPPQRGAHREGDQQRGA